MAIPPKRTRPLLANESKEPCPLPERMKKFGDLYDKVVTVEVGTEASKQFLHEGLLCHHSGYFRGALKGGFAESQDRTIRFSDLNEEVFAAFKNWIYTGTVAPFGPDGKGASLLIQLWVFGDMCAIPALQNAVMDSLVHSNTEHWTLPMYRISYVYDNTPENCTLRKLIVDMGAFSFPDMGRCLDKLPSISDVPQLYLCEILRIRVTEGPVKPLTQDEWKKIDKCQYHVHDAANEGRPQPSPQANA